VIQASHVSTGTTNNALALNPSGGNVGVGTTTPSVPFVVSGSSTGYTTGMMNVINNNTLPQACANILAPNISSTQGMLMNIGKSLTWNNAMGLAYYHQGDGLGTNFLNLAPYGNQNGLNVLANGTVGIGTTAPGAALHVVGSVVSYTYSHFYSGGTPTWSISNPLPNGTYLVSMSGSQTISYAGTFNYPPFAIGTTQIASLGGIASISFTAATLSVTFNSASAQNVTINFLRLG